MIFGIAYVLQHLIVAVLYASICLKLSACLPLRAPSRILFGIILTPFMIALSVYVLGLLAPGLPKIIFIIAPTAIAVLLLLCTHSQKELKEYALTAKKALKRRFQIMRASDPKPNYFLAAITLSVAVFATWLTLFSLGKAALLHVQAPVIDHDASHYLVQARYFAQDRDSWKIDNYSGTQAGTVAPDDHGPLWGTYLGQALMFHPTGDLGYPYDLTARVAIIATFAYMLLSIMVAAWMLCHDYRAALLALASLNLFPYLNNILRGFSRDGFRVVAIILLLLFLAGHIEQRLLERVKITRLPRFVDYGILALLSYFCMQGHGGNAFVLAFVGILFGLLLLLRRTPVRSILLFGVSMILGVLLSLEKNIRFALESSSFRHYTTTGLQGSPLYSLSGWTNANSAQEGERILTYTGNVGVYALALGMLGMLIAIIYYFAVIGRGKACVKSACNWRMFFAFSVLSFGVVLPMTGLFDVGSYRLSDWYILNFRYRLPLYAVCSVCAGALAGILLRKLARTPPLRVVTASVLLMLCYFSAGSIRPKVTDERLIRTQIAEYYRSVMSVAEKKSNGGRIVVNYERLNYFAAKPGLLFPSEHLRPLIFAKSTQELERCIDAYSIGAFVMIEETQAARTGGADRVTPILYAYLQTPENCERLMMPFSAQQINFAIYSVKGK